MADTDTPAVADANPNVLVFSVPNTGDPAQTVSIDLGTIPAETRLELLKQAVHANIYNRVSVTHSRHTVALKPFVAYDEAMKADPLQSAVAKPEGERPSAPDLVAKAGEAIKDLTEGKLRQRGKSTGEGRKAKDPLVSTVTAIVVRAVFDANKAAKADYKWTDAVKEVGGDGIAYLNAQIDAKVTAGADRAALEKARDTRFINPAKLMLGQSLTKAQSELPSIL